MLQEIPREEFSRCLDDVAMEVLAAAGVGRAPVDMLLVAEAIGVVVVWDSGQPHRGRYVRLNRARGREPVPTALLRPEPRRERWQWSLAHEIGEHVAHRVFEALMVDPREASPTAREQVANSLAGRMLLPGEWFAADAAACGWDLIELKSRYCTASHELIARRMLEFALPVIVTIFDNGGVSMRRSNVPGRVPDLSAAELHCRKMAHDENRPEELCDATRRVQAWPIHEPGWRREIVRTELEMEPIG